MPKPRKTTTTKVIEGDKGKLGKRKLAAKLAAEPRAEDGLPHAPGHLPERARVAWEFWREQLEFMQLDHRPDAIALEAACLNYSRAVDADIKVNREGIILEEPVLYRGEPIPGIVRRKKNPAVTVSATCWMLVKAFVCEFGFTPVSRTRLTVENKTRGAAEDLSKLLTGPRLSKEERDRLQ